MFVLFYQGCVFLHIFSNVALFQAALTKVPTFTLLQTKQKEAKEA